eukprot:57289-Chlamydomonas_euryale.AAC.1
MAYHSHSQSPNVVDGLSEPQPESECGRWPTRARVRISVTGSARMEGTPERSNMGIKQGCARWSPRLRAGLRGCALVFAAARWSQEGRHCAQYWSEPPRDLPELRICDARGRCALSIHGPFHPIYANVSWTCT